MPQMADIIVKKADNTTNITYNALTPSAGDKSWAQWRANSANTVAGFRPAFALKAEPTATGTARRVRDTYVYPVVRNIAGVDTIVAKIPFEGTGVVPANVTDAELAEAVAQYANLKVSTLVKASYTEGFGPT